MSFSSRSSPLRYIYCYLHGSVVSGEEGPRSVDREPQGPFWKPYLVRALWSLQCCALLKKISDDGVFCLNCWSRVATEAQK